VNWTGTAVNTGKVADAYAPDTTVQIDDDYSLQANFIRETDPEIVLLSPNGGETLSPGGTHTIRWRNPSQETFTAFNIEYTHEGKGWMQIVWISGGSESSYEWDLPEISAHECLVRVSGIRANGQSDISDTSNDVFSITGDAGMGESLRAHWRLDEVQGDVAYDSAGINDGLVYGNPTWVPGLMAGALHMNGMSDYVDSGNDPGLDITGEITLAAWINPHDIGNGQENPYVSKGRRAYALQGIEQGYGLEFFIYDKGAHSARFTRARAFNDEWHHVAGTYDGSQLRLYIDGALEGVTDHTGSIASTPYNVNIGRNAAAPNRLYEGLIDDVRVYDCALSEAEIRDLCFGIVAHWQMDETEGVMAWDSSGHGHHGTLYGNPTWLPTAGTLGGALEFDGNGDAVIIPALGQSVEFSYALWVNQTVIGPGLKALIDRQQWAPGAVHFELRDGHPKVGINQAIFPDGDLDAFGHTLDTDEWHHLALTKSTQRLMIYVDGEPAAQRALTVSDPVILGDGSIGQWDDSRYFHGLIDDVRIYEQALGPDDVLDLFARSVNVVVAPDVMGLDRATAESVVVALGLVPGTVSSRYSDMVPAGSVISQNPVPGTELPEGAAVALVVSLGPELTPADLPAEGLIAHWTLDETGGMTAFDDSGYDYHGTLYGNPTWLPTAGVLGGALDFDGQGDAVLIPALGQSVEFTYALWVNQTRIGNDFIALIDHRQWIPGSVHFELRDGYPKVGISQAIYPDGDLDAPGHVLNTGEWYHMALTKSAQRLMLYLDGAPVAQRTLTTSGPVILGDGSLGQWNYSRYFNGLLDDVRIYEQALAPEDIAALAH